MKTPMRDIKAVALSIAGVLALGFAGSSSQGEKGVPQAQLDPQRDRRPMIVQIGVSPTGANGYEDYLLAADIANRPDFIAHVRYLMRLEREAVLREQEPQAENEPWPPAPPGMSPTMSVLEAKRLIADRFGRIADLVRQGNQKPVHDPRKSFDSTTLFPELAYLKTIARFLDWSATAKFSEGHSAAALDILLQGLQFSTNVRSGSLIASLVGIACQAILTASFESHLFQLSERDAEKLAKDAKRLLDARPPYEEAYRREREAGLRYLWEAFGDLAKAKENLRINDATFAQIHRLLSKLSEPELDQVRTLAMRWADSIFDAVLKRVSSGESQWARRPGKALTRDPEEFLVNPPKTPADIAELFVSSLMPVHEAIFESFARDRIQLRLLRLHALVLLYKWQNGRLPSRLSSAVPQTELIDLAAGAPFQYAASGESYRLYSVGFGNWGEIDLRYRQKTVSKETGPVNPPPNNQRR